MAIELGTRKQVFIDWSLIDPGYGLPWVGPPTEPKHMPHGVRLAVHPPMVHPEPILSPQHPWEEVMINIYCTLLQEDGVLRLYYEAYAPQPGGAFMDDAARLCLAESTDGLTWQRKMLGLVEYNGARANNIVYAPELPGAKAGHGFTVFKDPSAPPPERYKLVHGTTLANPGYWRRTQVVMGAVSPDGLRWTPIEEPLLRHPCDTQTVVQYDAAAGVYRGYFRGLVPSHDELGRDFKGKGIHGRRVADQAFTKDFRHWPEPEPALYPEPTDPPDLDIYTPGYVPWPGTTDAHLLFPSCFSRATDVMEVHMATSRDGRTWKRLQRGPILPAGEPGTLGVGGIYAGQGIAAFDDRWLMPVAPQEFTHNTFVQSQTPPKDQRGLWITSIRPDGFTSLCADSRGECWTFPFVFSGNKLLVNSWARYGGNVRIGLEDKDGPIAGYGIADCEPLQGDCMWKPVTWKGNADLSRLAGKQIILRMQLIRVRLHAFRFSD